MAKISDETLNLVFDLQRQYLNKINESSRLALILFESFGETPETQTSLDELDSIKEKLTSFYSGLSTLILQISEYQPTAPSRITNLLTENINKGIFRIEAASASILEVKQYWRI